MSIKYLGNIDCSLHRKRDHLKLSREKLVGATLHVWRSNVRCSQRLNANPPLYSIPGASRQAQHINPQPQTRCPIPNPEAVTALTV